MKKTIVLLATVMMTMPAMAAKKKLTLEQFQKDIREQLGNMTSDALFSGDLSIGGDCTIKIQKDENSVNVVLEQDGKELLSVPFFPDNKVAVTQTDDEDGSFER